MSDFDNLRRAAERAIGSDAVRQIEREITSQASGRREVVDAARIRFPTQAEAPEGSPHGTAPAEAISQAVARSAAPVSGPPGAIPREPATPRSASERLLSKAITGEYAYAKLGLTLGIMCILGGLLLSLNGVAGATSWTAKFLGLESKINDAAPGVVLFIVGVFYVRMTKPRVKLRDLNG